MSPDLFQVRASLALHGSGPPGSWLMQERIQVQVQVSSKASFIYVEKERGQDAGSWWQDHRIYLELAATAHCSPGCKSHPWQLWKKWMYTVEWTRANLQVSCTHMFTEWMNKWRLRPKEVNYLFQCYKANNWKRWLKPLGPSQCKPTFQYPSRSLALKDTYLAVKTSQLNLINFEYSHMLYSLGQWRLLANRNI